MEQKDLCIEKIPAVIWGTHSNKMYLYVHGQGGNKKEAKDFASIAVKYGYQVLSKIGRASCRERVCTEV